MALLKVPKSCVYLLLLAAATHLVPLKAQVPRELVMELRTSKTASVIVLDESLVGDFASLVKAAALAEYDLQVISPEAFGAGPLNQGWAKPMMGAGDLWLVVDTKGQFVAKGRALPTPADLAQTLKKRGVLPAETYLRQFLKSHPHNQEARAALINLLHERAVAQTLKKLDITPEPKAGRDVDITATEFSGSASLKPASVGKTLDDESDLKIWARFAQELENLLSDPAWMAAPLALDGYLAEAHSKLVQTAYGRHIAKLQDALLSMPSSYHCWQLWTRFKSALPEKPLTAFLNALKPLPQELRGRNFLLDPKIVNLLLVDARTHGDWHFVRELLMSHFDAEFPPETPPQEQKSQSELWERAYRADSIDVYQNFMEPLIEALVSSGFERIVPDALRRFKAKRGDVPNLGDRLGNLAKRLERGDLASSWMGMVQ